MKVPKPPQAQTKKAQNVLEKTNIFIINQGGVIYVVFSFGSTQTISHSKRNCFCAECQRGYCIQADTHKSTHRKENQPQKNHYQR